MNDVFESLWKNARDFVLISAAVGVGTALYAIFQFFTWLF